MKQVHVKSALFLFLTVFCLQLFGQKDMDKLKSEIDAINAKLIKANIAGDMETLAGYYIDDAYYLPNYSPMIKGKAAIMDDAKKGEEEGYKMLSMNLNILDVIPAKEMVIEIGTYAISMNIPEMPMPVADQGKYVTVWERQKDGSLKIKVETWNTDVNPMEMGKKMMEKKKETEKDKMMEIDVEDEEKIDEEGK